MLYLNVLNAVFKCVKCLCQWFLYAMNVKSYFILSLFFVITLVFIEIQKCQCL